MKDNEKAKFRRSFHVCIVIDDQLSKTDEQLDEIAGCFMLHGVPCTTGAQVRSLLTKQKEDGWGVILPYACDHYDKKTGCLGHDIREDERS